MKLVAAHQIALLPWAGLIHKFLLSDQFIVMDNTQFRARAFMHRSHIEVNGSPLWVTWPIQSVNKNWVIKDLAFAERPILRNWLKETFKKLHHSYSKNQHWRDVAEYFNSVIELIEASPETSPVEIFCHFLEYLKIKADSDVSVTLESDFSKVKHEDATTRLLSHIQECDADAYIMGANSINYFEFKKNDFARCSLYIQDFSYSRFLEYQKSTTPLSFLHALSVLGWDGLFSVMFSENISRAQLRKSVSCQKIGRGNYFSNSYQDILNIDKE
jgi:hypothetical protein